MALLDVMAWVLVEAPAHDYPDGVRVQMDCFTATVDVPRASS